MSHPAGNPDESNTSTTLDPATTARCTAPNLTPPGTTQAGTTQDGWVWDGRPCGTPAVLRVSIDHDGRTCGCDGTCPTTPEGTGTPPVAAWTQVLLCAEHTAISCTASGGQFPPSARIEDLTGTTGTGPTEARS